MFGQYLFICSFRILCGGLYGYVCFRAICLDICWCDCLNVCIGVLFRCLCGDLFKGLFGSLLWNYLRFVLLFVCGLVCVGLSKYFFGRLFECCYGGWFGFFFVVCLRIRFKI